jgi:hypothetical protein
MSLRRIIIVSRLCIKSYDFLTGSIISQIERRGVSHFDVGVNELVLAVKICPD